MSGAVRRVRCLHEYQLTDRGEANVRMVQPEPVIALR